MDHGKNDGDAYPHGFGFPYQQHLAPRHLFPSNSFSGGGSVAIPPTFQHLNHSGSFRHPPPPEPCPPYHIPHFVPFDPIPLSFHHHHHQIHHHHHHSFVLPSHSSSFSDYEASSQHSRHSSLATSSPIEVLPDGRLQDMVVYGHPVTSLHGSISSPHFATLPSPSAGSHHFHGASFDGQPMVPFASHKGQASLKVLLLHGSLDVWVCEARFLPNKEQFSKTLGDMLGPRLTSTLSGKMRQLPSITSDPYVTIMVSGATIGRTYVLSNTEDPVWMQHFNLPVAHHAAEVQFLVKHNDIVGAQLIGTVSIPAEWIYSGERLEGFYPILDSNGKQCKAGAVLKLSIQYFPVAKLTMYHHGISAGPAYCGVPGTYFPLRKGGKVTLYQDAHVSDGCLPELKLENGMNYVHGKCWRDIYDAIIQARRLIYIIGWSVFHAVRLVRDTGHDSCPTLGDLLKSKSQEGVRVLLLVWDDPTSRSILGIRTVVPIILHYLFVSSFPYANFALEYSS